jgi:hypothetical protein
MTHAGPAEPIGDPARGAAWMLEDDGFGVGVIYSASEQPHPAHLHRVVALAEIEQEFAL